RHLAYYLRQAVQTDERMQSKEADQWCVYLEQEQLNFRTVLAWSVEHKPESALQVAASLAWFWQVRGEITEGLDWLIKPLNVNEKVQTIWKAKGLTRAGFMAYQQSNFAQARSLCDAGLAVFQQLRDHQGIGRALNVQGLIAVATGDYA